MSDKTKIEWTDMTWNPTRGCSRVSPGCQHCYAERVALRFSGAGQPYDGLLHKSGAWNGKIRLVPEALQIPWRKSRGRRIFVDSMSDLFHPGVPFEYIAAVFFVMSVTTRHTYQVLTKRPERALEFFRWAINNGDENNENDTLFGLHHEHSGWFMDNTISDIGREHPAIKAFGRDPWREGKRNGGYDNCGPGWPYENVHIGVSVENQAAFDERVDLLRQIPAAVRFISAEPLLGPVRGDLSGISWLICGGESGADARPMHPDWARALRDQCAEASVAFFHKQNGEFVDFDHIGERWNEMSRTQRERQQFVDGKAMIWVGKKAAGRLLDGRTHDEFPE